MLQLLILLLTVLVLSRAECPSMCTCKHFPRELMPVNYLYYTFIKCEGFNGGEVLSNSTRILEISSLNTSSFSDLFDSLSESDLPELNTLVLTQSILTNISDLLSVVSDRLKHVTLSKSGLTEFPQMTTNLSLVSLDLSGNDLSSLQQPYQALRTLESLNLSVNNIQTIDSNTFNNLTNLNHLDLSQNNLTSLDNQFFTPLVSLQYLNLSHNHIEVLNDRCFSSLVKLQQLDVSWNNLARVTLGSLQLPSLTRLLLAGNPQLGESHEILGGVGQRLQTVDASGTGLKQVPAALTHSIRTLKLAENDIKAVACGELDSFPLLQILDFTSNDVASIEEDATGRLESLSILYLTDNKLQAIPRSLPEEMTVLRLEFNVIEKVLKDDLNGLSKLEVLLLNDNKISFVEGGAFECLRSLVTLDLSRNPVKALYPGSLSGPSALQILRLSGIDTVSPAEDTSFPLSAPDHLVSLDLSGSSGLARQLLADNALLAASRELQELDISGADLEFIRSDLLHFLPQLRIIHIRDNRLNCTDLQWLASWMRRQDHAEYRSVICSSPSELWGTPLVDLQYVEISSIKQINHERVQDFQGTINLATAAEKSSPSGKYVTERIADMSGPITNGFINSVGNTSAADNTTQMASTEDNKLQLSLKGTAKGETVKSAKEILVSNVNSLSLSALIPVSSKQKNYVDPSRPLQIPQSINEAGAINTKETANDGNSTESNSVSTRMNNGSVGVLNKTEASLNLTLPNERIFNDTSASSENNGGRGDENGMQHRQLTDVNMTDNMSEWNAPTVKNSMYRNNDDPTTRLLHPGLLILTVCVLCGAAALAILATKCNNRKRWMERSEELEQIPVASISSVSELW